MPNTVRQRFLAIMNSTRAATMVSMTEIQQMAQFCIQAQDMFSMLRQTCFEADMQRVGIDPKSLSEWLSATEPKFNLIPVPKEACNGPEH